jgi:hypothetical protein
MRPKKDPMFDASQLGNLLERYKKVLKPPQASMEKECLEVIKEITTLELNPKQITYTVATKTISITAPSILRSELKRSYPEIIKALQKRLGVQNAPDTII